MHRLRPPDGSRPRRRTRSLRPPARRYPKRSPPSRAATATGGSVGASLPVGRSAVITISSTPPSAGRATNACPRHAPRRAGSSRRADGGTAQPGLVDPPALRRLEPVEAEQRDAAGAADRGPGISAADDEPLRHLGWAIAVRRAVERRADARPHGDQRQCRPRDREPAAEVRRPPRRSRSWRRGHAQDRGLVADDGHEVRLDERRGPGRGADVSEEVGRLLQRTDVGLALGARCEVGAVARLLGARQCAEHPGTALVDERAAQSPVPVAGSRRPRSLSSASRIRPLTVPRGT
jgi:hypothetical protein